MVTRGGQDVDRPHAKGRRPANAAVSADKGAEQAFR